MLDRLAQVIRRKWQQEEHVVAEARNVRSRSGAAGGRRKRSFELDRVRQPARHETRQVVDHRVVQPTLIVRRGRLFRDHLLVQASRVRADVEERPRNLVHVEAPRGGVCTDRREINRVIGRCLLPRRARKRHDGQDDPHQRQVAILN